MLLPHEVLDAIVASGSFTFESVMLGNFSAHERCKFWRHVANKEPWRNHPVVLAGGLDKLVPVSIHGDGGEMFRDDEYFLWSWSSCFGSVGAITNCSLQKFPICVIPERLMKLQSDACSLFCPSTVWILDGVYV